MDRKKIVLSTPTSLIFIILSSIALTGLMFLIQPNGVSDVITCIIESGFMPLVLNLLPIILIMLLIYFASGSFSLSLGLTSFVVMALSVANRYKLIYRHDPLMPWDFLLGAEFLGILKSFPPLFIFGIIFLIIAMVGIIIAMVIFIKNEKLDTLTRVCGTLMMVIVIVLCNNGIMSNTQVNQNMHVIGNIYNQANQYNSKGFLYSFIYTYNTSKITKPANYDPAEIEEQIQLYTEEPANTTPNDEKPHVILILGEAFSDIALSPDINFEGYPDPMENYKEIIDDGISGTLVVPNFGGGTADTEFDILTGDNTRDFRGVPYANMLITKPFNSIATVFGENGYNCQAMHPGYPWFYNRENVYPYLGFEQFTSLDSFDEEDNIAGYISEEATYDRLISDYEDNKAKGTEPLFELCITIQNHGPYEDKYAAAQNFNPEVPMSDKDINTLSNYFYGLEDQDEQLGRLIEYMENEEEPVMIVYFGDHLPLISQEACDALIPGATADPESFTGKTRLHQTPYFVWENSAAKEANRDETVFTENEVISSFYLGAAMLEYLGFDKEQPFFNYLNQMRDEYPVIMERQYFTSDYEPHDVDPNEDNPVTLYKKWQYYNIFDSSS